jgi:hypothetical protein
MVLDVDVDVDVDLNKLDGSGRRLLHVIKRGSCVRSNWKEGAGLPA